MMRVPDLVRIFDFRSEIICAARFPWRMAMKTVAGLFVLLFMNVVLVNAQGYRLVWSDEFDSTSLDQTKWSYETGNNGGWGNSELEDYTSRSQNCSVGGGYLTIAAQQESYGGYNYTSARIKTEGKFSFEYGKIEARIKLPSGKGMWPAFWMLGDDISSVGWPSCGENDIMEMIGGSGTGSTGSPLSDATVYGTLHWNQNGSASAGGKYSLSSGKFGDDFHLIGVVWTSRLIQFYVDGAIYYQVDISPTAMSAFRNKFFIILNLAVGGNWPGNPDSTTSFPQTMQVDYVRVYEDTTQLPSVSIASPANNSSLTAYSDISISANASIQGGTISRVDFFQDAMKIGETYVSPFEMRWKNVFPGNYRLSAVAYASGGASGVSDTVRAIVGSGAATSPYGGTPARIPGTIEAENYDLGGEGSAYHDTDPQNTGGLYRPDDGVDIESCTDSGDGFDVGWTQPSEWILYTVDVSDSGSCQIAARVASTSASGSMHFEIDGVDVTGIMNVPNTGGWQIWATVQSSTVTLASGIHYLKFFVNSGQFNVNRFYIYPPGASPSLNLLYPNGGEEFSPDSVVEISWQSQFVDQVRIGLSTSGGGFYSLVQSGVDAGFGVYRWKVPAGPSSSCKILVMDQNATSVMDTSDSVFSIGTATSVRRETGNPTGFSLGQNYPNPFNPTTGINYRLAESSFVKLKVFDLLGREIRTLVEGPQVSGEHDVVFDAGSLPSGVYFCRLEAGGITRLRKMVLVK